MQCIPSWSSSLQARSKASTTSEQAPLQRLGPTSGGVRHAQLMGSPSQTQKAKTPIGAHSLKLTGTRSTITARWNISLSSIASSDVQLLPTSTNKIMSKIKMKVTINMEHMSRDEQIRFMIRLADKGLLPPCPPEIRQKYAPKPENK